MAATVLDLQYGACPAKTGDRKGREGAVAAVRIRRAAGSVRPGQQAAFEFLRHDGVGHAVARRLSGGKARRAACQHNARAGRIAAQTGDGMTGIAFSARRDGAGVDADDVSRAGIVAFRAAPRDPCLAQSLRLVLVDFTAEGDKVKFPRAHTFGCTQMGRA